MPRKRDRDAPRVVYRTARCGLRATRAQRSRVFGLLRSAGDVWCAVLELNSWRRARQDAPLAGYQELCRQLAASGPGTFGELGSTGARSVLRRYSDAWFTAAKRRRAGDTSARFPRRRRGLVPLRWYAGTFTLDGRVLGIPVARGCAPLLVRLDRDVPYPPGQVRSVTLGFDAGRLYLDVTAEIPVAVYPQGTGPDPARVAGVDLGIIHPYAVAGPGGQQLLVSGRAIRAECRQHLRDRKGRTRAAARRAPKPGQKGSRRWRRHKRRQRHAEARHLRRVRQAQHEAAKAVVSWAVERRVGMLAVGDPRGVLKLDAGRRHNQRTRDWRVGHLIRVLKDKAEAAGITVRLVDERGTSSTCPACARRVPRPAGRNFRCPHCGHQGHRDLIAAANIAARNGGGTIPAPVTGAGITHRRAGAHLPGVHPARRDPRRGPPSRPPARGPLAGTGPPRTGSRSPTSEEPASRQLAPANLRTDALRKHAFVSCGAPRRSDILLSPDDRDLRNLRGGNHDMNEQGNALGSLFGRERELAAVRELLDGAAAQGAALLVRGRAGMGRSSLLAAVAAAASSRRMKTLAVTGTRLEAGLPFAGLHQLVQPFMEGIGGLPAPQRDAVLTAFGMSPGTDPNLLFVALGTLKLLAAAAAGDPLVLLADDAQWLDVATSEVLAIIARRLEPTPLVLVAAARAGYHTPLTCAGLAGLDLHPLAPCAARTLLDASVGPLTSAEREQVLADAEGNPLALIELSGPLRAGRAACGGMLPTLPALTSRLEQAFGTRDHELPAVARTLLLIAAASDDDDLTEVLAAGAAAGLRHACAEALAPAAAADLIHITGSVFRFPHLLARSAVYCEAALPDRHAAHAALAGVLAGQPERAAWHAAATATRPDETVAGEMELAARRALRTGGVVAALAATERAVTLTADPALRGGRLLRAAELARDAGRVEAARRLMAQARPLRLRSTDRTRLAWLDQATNPGGPNDAASLRRLTGLAGQASKDRDHDLALSILDTAALACLEAGHDGDTRQLVIAAIEAIPALSGSPQPLPALAVADPDGQGALIIAAVSGLRQCAGHDLTDADDVLAAGVAATIAGDPETGASFLASAITPLRAQGRLRLLARGLVVQAWGATCRSDWNVAIPAAAEGIRLAQETEQPVFVTMGLCSQLTLAALRADVDAARSLMLHAERQLALGQGGYGLAAVQTARGLAALGAGRYEEAYEHLRRTFIPGDLACHYLQRCWAIADLVEAAVHSGHREQACAHVSEVARTAERTPSPFLHASLAYARLMLVSDDEAEQRFEAAANVELASWPFFRARAQLAYGAWLRRQRRITESRRPLRAACTAFDALGAGPWAERARQELRAAGKADSGARPGEGGVLSPQELQIAEMAASGMSNREIGQHLYLSHRTVATHLYRIFPKLGITSRFQMPQALRALSAVGTSAVPVR